MYFSNEIFGNDYSWHIGTMFLIMILFIWNGYLLYRLIKNTNNQTLNKSGVADYVHSKEKEHSHANRKVIETYFK